MIAMTLPEFSITREIKVGDLLTSFSIVISAIAFLRTWAKDREMRNREIADKVRNAAAMTLAKLARWQELSLWLFQYAQPLFVETSEILLKDFDIVAARDFLWKKLSKARTEVSGKIIDEQIEMAYVELYGYHAEVYALFTRTIEKLKENQDTVYNQFIKSAQRAVLSYKDNKENYQTAILGNNLRTIAYESHNYMKTLTDQTLNPIHEFLVGIISESDKDVLRRKRLPKSTKA